MHLLLQKMDVVTPGMRPRAVCSSEESRYSVSRYEVIRGICTPLSSKRLLTVVARIWNAGDSTKAGCLRGRGFRSGIQQSIFDQFKRARLEQLVKIGVDRAELRKSLHFGVDRLFLCMSLVFAVSSHASLSQRFLETAVFTLPMDTATLATFSPSREDHGHV